LLIFIAVFYQVLFSIVRRVFLVGFFDHAANNYSRESQDDKLWLKQRLGALKIEDLCKPVFPFQSPSNFIQLRETENDILKYSHNGDDIILKIHLALVPLYEAIWQECSDAEKLTLYEFAHKGITNYKKVLVLYQLFEKGLLVKEDENVVLMTKSFQSFLAAKEFSAEIISLTKPGKGSLNIMRIVFYIILIAIAIFVFISQEDATNRLITILTSLAALVPLVFKIFDNSISGINDEN
jgi:hypothetical protein